MVIIVVVVFIVIFIFVVNFIIFFIVVVIIIVIPSLVVDYCIAVVVVIYISSSKPVCCRELDARDRCAHKKTPSYVLGHGDLLPCTARLPNPQDVVLGACCERQPQQMGKAWKGGWNSGLPLQAGDGLDKPW
jgi:hypothetical protein